MADLERIANYITQGLVNHCRLAEELSEGKIAEADLLRAVALRLPYRISAASLEKVAVSSATLTPPKAKFISRFAPAIHKYDDRCDQCDTGLDGWIPCDKCDIAVCSHKCLDAHECPGKAKP
jgi:hypothetical protein